MKWAIQNPHHKNVLKLESQRAQRAQFLKTAILRMLIKKNAVHLKAILGLDCDLDHQQNLMECVLHPSPAENFI